MSKPRYFIEHDTIHDSVTGKHVEMQEASNLLVDLSATCERLERERDDARMLRRDAQMERDDAIKYRDSYFQNWKIAESNKLIAKQDAERDTARAIAAWLDAKADRFCDVRGMTAAAGTIDGIAADIRALTWKEHGE